MMRPADSSVLHATGKRSKVPYINRRVDIVTNQTVGTALQMTYTRDGSSCELRYKWADLKYDLNHGMLEYAADDGAAHRAAAQAAPCSLTASTGSRAGRAGGFSGGSGGGTAAKAAAAADDTPFDVHQDIVPLLPSSAKKLYEDYIASDNETVMNIAEEVLEEGAAGVRALAVQIVKSNRERYPKLRLDSRLKPGTLILVPAGGMKVTELPHVELPHEYATEAWNRCHPYVGMRAVCDGPGDASGWVAFSMRREIEWDFLLLCENKQLQTRTQAEIEEGILLARALKASMSTPADDDARRSRTPVSKRKKDQATSRRRPTEPQRYRKRSNSSGRQTAAAAGTIEVEWDEDDEGEDEEDDDDNEAADKEVAEREARRERKRRRKEEKRKKKERKEKRKRERKAQREDEAARKARRERREQAQEWESEPATAAASSVAVAAGTDNDASNQGQAKQAELEATLRVSGFGLEGQEAATVAAAEATAAVPSSMPAPEPPSTVAAATASSAPVLGSPITDTDDDSQEFGADSEAAAVAVAVAVPMGETEAGTGGNAEPGSVAKAAETEAGTAAMAEAMAGVEAEGRAAEAEMKTRAEAELGAEVEPTADVEAGAKTGVEVEAKAEGEAAAAAVATAEEAKEAEGFHTADTEAQSGDIDVEIDAAAEGKTAAETHTETLAEAEARSRREQEELQHEILYSEDEMDLVPVEPKPEAPTPRNPGSLSDLLAQEDITFDEEVDADVEAEADVGADADVEAEADMGADADVEAASPGGTVVTVEATQAEDECAVCKGGDNDLRFHTLDCRHTFHVHCLNNWLRSAGETLFSCPTCRQHIDSYPYHDEVQISENRGWVDGLDDPDECAECGEGGGLLQCEGACRQWKHQTCWEPQVPRLPEGAFLCAMCADSRHDAEQEQASTAEPQHTRPNQRRRRLDSDDDSDGELDATRGGGRWRRSSSRRTRHHSDDELGELDADSGSGQHRRGSSRGTRRRRDADADVCFKPEDALQVSRLKQRLKQERDKSLQYTKALYNAFCSRLDTIKEKYGIDKPVEAYKPQEGRGGDAEEGVVVAMVSDLQLGKRTDDYSSEQCAIRMRTYLEHVIRNTEKERHVRIVRECRVWLLGDIVEGEAIFKGQVYETHLSLMEQVDQATTILAQFIRGLLRHFTHVHICGVVGNHGRLKRGDYDPRTNADKMVYKMTATLLDAETKSQRISWAIPQPQDHGWFHVEVVGNYRCLLLHGDEFGSNMKNLEKKVLQYLTLGHEAAERMPRFQDVAFGHYHHVTTRTINSSTIRGAGSVESSNDYARRLCGAMSQASQRMLIFSPKTCEVFAEYPEIRLVAGGRVVEDAPSRGTGRKGDGGGGSVWGDGAGAGRGSSSSGAWGGPWGGAWGDMDGNDRGGGQGGGTGGDGDNDRGGSAWGANKDEGQRGSEKALGGWGRGQGHAGTGEQGQGRSGSWGGGQQEHGPRDERWSSSGPGWS